MCMKYASTLIATDSQTSRVYISSKGCSFNWIEGVFLAKGNYYHYKTALVARFKEANLVEAAQPGRNLACCSPNLFLRTSIRRPSSVYNTILTTVRSKVIVWRLLKPLSMGTINESLHDTRSSSSLRVKEAERSFQQIFIQFGRNWRPLRNRALFQISGSMATQHGLATVDVWINNLMTSRLISSLI